MCTLATAPAYSSLIIYQLWSASIVRLMQIGLIGLLLFIRVDDDGCDNYTIIGNIS